MFYGILSDRKKKKTTTPKPILFIVFVHWQFFLTQSQYTLENCRLLGHMKGVREAMEDLLEQQAHRRDETAEEPPSKLQRKPTRIRGTLRIEVWGSSHRGAVVNESD